MPPSKFNRTTEQATEQTTEQATNMYIAELNEQLNLVLSELHLYSTRISKMKCGLFTEDFKYQRSVNNCSRESELQIKFKPGKDPPKSTTFLIRSVIEALCTGGCLSEKDIKLSVIEKCKEHGIKSTNRGTIAGLNLDVAMVCNVLSSLGVVELASVCGVVQESSEPIFTSISSSMSASELGTKVCGLISSRWAVQLGKYLSDCKKSVSLNPDSHSSQQSEMQTFKLSSGTDQGEEKALSFLSLALPSVVASDDVDKNPIALSTEGFQLVSPVLSLASPSAQTFSVPNYAEMSLQEMVGADNSFVGALMNSPGQSPVSNSRDKSADPAEVNTSFNLLPMNSHDSLRLSQCFFAEEESETHDGRRHLDCMFDGSSGHANSMCDNLHGDENMLLSDSELGMLLDASLLSPNTTLNNTFSHNPGSVAPLDDTHTSDSVGQEKSADEQHLMDDSLQLLLLEDELGDADQLVSFYDGGGAREEDDISLAQSEGAKSVKSSGTGNGSVLSAVQIKCNGKGVGSGRRSTASQRVWRIADGVSQHTDVASTSPRCGGLQEAIGDVTGIAANVPANVPVLLQPVTALSGWSSAVYSQSAALEVEEGLLRRLAGQCDMPLKSNPYRCGTNYLDPQFTASEDTGDMLGDDVGLCNDMVSAGGWRTRSDQPSSMGDSNAEDTSPLFDDSVLVTGSLLLEKVRRSKRQKGSALASSGHHSLFSVQHVTAMTQLCSAANVAYWNNSMLVASVGTGISVPASKVSGSHVSKKPHSAPSALSSRHASVECCTGLLVPTGNHYSRHYSLPLVIQQESCCMPPDTRPAALLSGTKVPLTSSAQHMPDLSISTLEIPWYTMAREFVALSAGEEAGTIFLDPIHTATSVSGKRAEPQVEMTNNGAIKRQYSSMSVASMISAGNAESDVTGVSAPPPKKKYNTSVVKPVQRSGSESVVAKMVEVTAPMFREVPAPTYSSQLSISEVGMEEEDLSDDAFLARHDLVLKNMREKWALLQSLKNETALARRVTVGPGSVLLDASDGGKLSPVDLLQMPPVTYSGSGSHMKYKKYLSSVAAASGTGASPTTFAAVVKKRGHNMLSGASHLKRRGRPPKAGNKSGSNGLNSAGYVSQRGNNQYTAIHAAAAAAAALLETLPSELAVEGSESNFVTDDKLSGQNI